MSNTHAHTLEFALKQHFYFFSFFFLKSFIFLSDLCDFDIVLNIPFIVLQEIIEF